ncbi:MAG: acylneuraminate cytidylyltransferase family protein [Planctomycetota bacterium]
MSAIAIILGRAGSKGVPNKNMRDVAGRPCVAWTIDHARDANTVSRTVLSTDDPLMQQLGLDLGLDVVARPPELAHDTAMVDDAARHALASIDPDDVLRARTPIVILYANAPVRPPGLIDRAVTLLIKRDADSVQSCCTVGKHHPWWTCVVNDAGDVRPWQGDVLNHNVYRRQDLPPAHVPDGGVLVCTKRALTLRVSGVTPGPHAFFGTHRLGVLTDPGEVIDIDSEIDLLIAHHTLNVQRTERLP